MTVIDFITDVLGQISIISEIETPSAEQGQDAVTKLNDMFADLLADGIDFGWNPKATTAENIVVPDGDIAGLKAMLGVRLCEGYGVPVPQMVGAMADAGYKRMLRRAVLSSMQKVYTDAPSGETRRYRYNILTGR